MPHHTTHPARPARALVSLRALERLDQVKRKLTAEIPKTPNPP